MVIWQDLIRPIHILRSAWVRVVQKKSGSRRIIVQFSAPDGTSTNDGISTDQYSLEYIPVDNIVTNVRHHGTVGLLFKGDIQHAFRNVPVHPEDSCILGMKWNNQYYVSKVSPSGLVVIGHL